MIKLGLRLIKIGLARSENEDQKSMILIDHGRPTPRKKKRKENASGRQRVQEEYGKHLISMAKGMVQID